MKRNIQRNHDAGTDGGAGNAGADLSSQFDLTDDDLKGGKKGDNGSSGNPPTKTPEQIAAEQAAATKAAADLETAKKFGGTKLDDKGNVLDANGAIIKTADEIKNDGGSNSPQAVEIDGVQYALDKDGNAVDKDGKVFKTKAEIDALENDGDDLPLVEELRQKVGIEIKGNDGKPKVYEDSIEGLIELSNDIASTKYNQQIKKFFDSFPEVKEFAQHLQNGGKASDFYTKQSSSWKNFQFDEKNEDHLTNAVVSELVSKGMSKEQAEFTAKTYKDTDKLKAFGKDAYGRLVAEETRIANEAIQQQALLEQEENSKIEKHWNNVKTIVKTGKIDNINIPETERDEFFNYIALAADENGNSKATLDRLNLPIEKQLQLDYLLYKGLDLQKLIQNLVKSENVKTLRRRLGDGRGDKGLAGGQGNNAGNVKPNDVEISMDNFVTN